MEKMTLYRKKMGGVGGIEASWLYLYNWGWIYLSCWGSCRSNSRHRDGQSQKNLVNADWLSPEALCQRLRLQLCASGVRGMWDHFFWRKTTPPTETDQGHTKRSTVFESSPMIFFFPNFAIWWVPCFSSFCPGGFSFFGDRKSRWPKGGSCAVTCFVFGRLFFIPFLREP